MLSQSQYLSAYGYSLSAPMAPRPPADPDFGAPHAVEGCFTASFIAPVEKPIGIAFERNETSFRHGIVCAAVVSKANEAVAAALSDQ